MPSRNSTAWVPMNRPHGPCSSSSSRATTVDKGVDVDDMLLWDQLRTSNIRTQLSADVGSAGAGVPIIARTTKVSNQDYMPASQAAVGQNSGTSKSVRTGRITYYANPWYFEVLVNVLGVCINLSEILVHFSCKQKYTCYLNRTSR